MSGTCQEAIRRKSPATRNCVADIQKNREKILLNAASCVCIHTHTYTCTHLFVSFCLRNFIPHWLNSRKKCSTFWVVVLKCSSAFYHKMSVKYGVFFLMPVHFEIPFFFFSSSKFHKSEQPLSCKFRFLPSACSPTSGSLVESGELRSGRKKTQQHLPECYTRCVRRRPTL